MPRGYTTPRTPNVYPISPHSFHEAAQFQRVCAVCEAPGKFHAHHVVSKQRLKRDGHYECLYDGRNSLRLCEGLGSNQCHMEHEGGKLTIETAKLTNENICFLWDMLGVAGQNYLDRHYTGVDRRYTLHEEKGCPVCQR